VAQGIAQRVVGSAPAGQQGVVITLDAAVAQPKKTTPRQLLRLRQKRLRVAVGIAQHGRGHGHAVVAGGVFAHFQLRPLAPVAAQGVGFGNRKRELQRQGAAAQVAAAELEGAVGPAQHTVEAGRVEPLVGRQHQQVAPAGIYQQRIAPVEYPAPVRPLHLAVLLVGFGGQHGGHQVGPLRARPPQPQPQREEQRNNNGS